MRQAFLEKVPALGLLTSGVQSTYTKQGFLRGLDGRELHIRSSHAALNTLLQSAGALVCKRWIVEFVKLLRSKGWYQTKVKIVAWVHDELQMEVDESLVTEDGEDLKSAVGDLCIEAIIKAGDHFGIRVPLDGEYKVGHNWKDCH